MGGKSRGKREYIWGSRGKEGIMREGVGGDRGKRGVLIGESREKGI